MHLQRWGINMRIQILCLTLFILLLPVLSFGADWIPFGATSPYDGVIFTEPNAQKLLEDVQMCSVTQKENLLFKERMQIEQDINDNLSKQRDAYKNGYEEISKLLDNQISMTKKVSDQCQDMIKNSKPSIWDDIKKIAVGIVLGIAVQLL